MLPQLTLTTSEFLSPDRLQGAGGLVPDAADTLYGEFASVLQSQVTPAVPLQAPAGEELPLSGNVLPVTIAVDELPLDADVELSIDDVDLPPTGLQQPLASGAADAALSTVVAQAAPDGAVPVVAEDGMPVRINVPPELEHGDGSDPAVPDAAVANAGEDLPDPPQVPAVAPAATMTQRVDSQELRDMAHDATTVRQRSMAVERSRSGNAARTIPANESDVRAAAGHDATIDDHEPWPTLRREPRSVAPGLSRIAAPSPEASDNAPRAVRDDGFPVPRPVQPAPWQPGSPLVETAPDPGHRIHTDVAPVMPRSASVPPAQALTSLPPAAQVIDIPVQHPGWDNMLADRVTMMANGKLQNAELRLTPAELGPLRIQLEIDDGVANVSFQSQHPITREALEQAMPRLRELLAENGLSLGQADVRDESGQQRSGEMRADAATSAAGADGGDPDESATTHTRRRAGDSLVDTFA